MNDLTKLLVSTLHAKFDDYPWITFTPGLEVRLVHARPSQNLTVVQLRAQPGARSGLHRHLAPTFGFTTKGAWSHDPHDFAYQPNSYVCEPNELHRFHNGPAVSEAYYINTGDSEQFDDEGREVISRRNAAQYLQNYLQQCEEAGLPRPNILR